MRKAFLCHSSKDKGYVEVVARRLGRARVIFDSMYFDPGVDFREAIQAGLDESRVFVYLVSRESLNSVWCKYEVNNAEYRKLTESLRHCLCIIIDRTVSYGDLPQWLQRSRVVVQTRPSLAVRDIQHALFTTALAGETHPFVGRQTESADFARALAVPTLSPPHVLIITGLDGIGRRSYLARVVYDNLALTLGPHFFMDDTRDLTDIYLWALDETSEFGTRAELAEESRLFAGLHQDEQVREIVARLKIMCEGRSLPCFVDQGGLLEHSGNYRGDIAALVDAFTADHNDGYLAFIHSRKPFTRDFKYADAIFQQRVPPLERHDAALLLAQLLSKRERSASVQSVGAIADHLGGYAPAIYFAATYISEYGIDALRHDSNTLVDFKAKRFLRLISELRLRDIDWQIAQYLAAEQLLPLEAIAVALNQSPDEIAVSLRQLIDHNLVVLIDDKYGISSPIREALHRVKGDLPSEVYGAICRNLTREFWPSTGAAPTVEIVDATLHAVAMSGSKAFDSYHDLVRVSTIHRLAQESYRRRDWRSAYEYAKRAESLAPERQAIHHIKFKALVQLEDWQAANDVLAVLRQRRDRGAFYLEGFMLRRRRKYEGACKAFKAAIEVGDNSFPVRRDYADCLNRVGKNSEALAQIRWILERDADNIFTLDLMCRICIDAGELDEAGRVLGDLERCDVNEQFVHHRRASWLAAKKEFDLAVLAASAACNSGHAPFSAHALRCGILIEVGDFKGAHEQLQYIQDRFGKIVRRDVQVGLRAKLLLRQRKWREAMVVLEGYEEKDSVVHKSLWSRIMSEKSKDASVSLADRKSAAEEAATILSDIHVNEYRIWSEEGLNNDAEMML